MKTKKLLSLLALAAVVFPGLGIGLAGESSYPPKVIPPMPLGCACFEPGFEFSGFGGGFLPDNGGADALGGGISLGYFFTENLGAEFSYGVYATDPSEEHVVAGNLVLRAPIEDLCIAPYLLVGGGLLTNSGTDGFFDVGGGIDIRFESWSCVGIFADATYNWAEDDREFTLIRTGLRIPF